MGFEADAQRFLAAALAADPANLEAIKALQGGDPRAFHAALVAALDRDPDHQLVELLGAIDPALAAAKAQAILARDPERVHVLRVLLRIDPQGGLVALRAARAADPEDTTLLDMLADAVPEEAWSVVTAALNASPNDYGLLSSAVVAAQAQEDPGRAALLIEAGLAMTPELPRRLDLIEVLARVDPSAAIAHYEQLGMPIRDPGHVHALAKGYFQVGRTQDGLAFARRLVALETAEGGESYLLSVLLDENDPSAGYQVALDVAAADPTDFRTRSQLLRAYGEHGRGSELARAAESWIQTATRASDTYWLGRVLEELGRDDLAPAAYRKALELDPTETDPLDALVQLDPNQALELLEPLLRQQPGQGSLRYVLKEGLRELALVAPACVVPWLDRFPTDPVHQDVSFLDRLGDTCAERGGSKASAAARTLWERAQRLDPDELREDDLAELGD